MFIMGKSVLAVFSGFPNCQSGVWLKQGMGAYTGSIGATTGGTTSCPPGSTFAALSLVQVFAFGAGCAVINQGTTSVAIYAYAGGAGSNCLAACFK